MAQTTQTSPKALAAPNSPQRIATRVATGRISWAGPLLLTVGRSIFIVAAQAVAALILAVRGDHTPWMSAGRWWTVDGTLADIGCLLLLWKFTRSEGTRLRDLVGPIRWRHGRDLWTGLGLFLLLFPLFVLGGMLANLLVYGSALAGPNPTGAPHHAFPTWGIIYSLSVWWLVWTPTEQMTYQGYALPRLVSLAKRRWVAIAFVWFWWSLQHSFLPFVPEWRYVILRFVMVAPGLLVMMLLYLRWRHLPLFIIAQWPMDIVAASMSTLM